MRLIDLDTTLLYQKQNYEKVYNFKDNYYKS